MFYLAALEIVRANPRFVILAKVAVATAAGRHGMIAYRVRRTREMFA
jgi:hypothetical protein